MLVVATLEVRSTLGIFFFSVENGKYWFHILYPTAAEIHPKKYFRYTGAYISSTNSIFAFGCFQNIPTPKLSTIIAYTVRTFDKSYLFMCTLWWNKQNNAAAHENTYRASNIYIMHLLPRVKYARIQLLVLVWHAAHQSPILSVCLICGSSICQPYLQCYVSQFCIWLSFATHLLCLLFGVRSAKL